jgi:hypothetical protein
VRRTAGPQPHELDPSSGAQAESCADPFVLRRGIETPMAEITRRERVLDSLAVIEGLVMGEA